MVSSISAIIPAAEMAAARYFASIVFRFPYFAVCRISQVPRSSSLENVSTNANSTISHVRAIVVGLSNKKSSQPFVIEEISCAGIAYKWIISRFRRIS